MCGICGISIYQSSAEIQEPIIRSMIDSFKHRGPDESSIYISSYVGLGIARLKVIDLESGSQPIFNEDKSIVVICNGEIINFVELRKELETKGHHFYTKSDTEIIVHLYETYGTDCLKFLNGMFAFALWDNKNKLLMLARDHLGIKPLYYFSGEDKLEFASELRALLIDRTLDKTTDIEALYDYLALMFIPAPKTIFKKIKKLESGHYLLWKNGILNDYTYWRLNDFPSQDRGEKYYIEKLDNLLKNTAKMWLRSDVPLGLFLSGGMDSTLLANYITQEVKGLNTFTAIFGQEGYDETLFAQRTAENLQTNHREISISQILPEVIYKITEHFDEPFADFSSIPFYLLSQESKKYITVAITGDGGDEVFAGYPTYIATKLVPYYKKLPSIIRRQLLPFIISRMPVSKSAVSIDYMAKRFIEGQELPWPVGHIFWQGAFSCLDYPQLFQNDVWDHLANKPLYKDLEIFFKETEHWPLLERLLYIDQKTLLSDDYLVRADRMSMAHSLEIRPMFLDRNIVEFMHTVPGHYKLRGWQTKWILRRLYKKILPEQKFNPSKRGFSPPMNIWLCGKLKPLCEKFLLGEDLNKNKIFKPEYVRRLWQEHLRGTHNHTRKIWTLLSFFIWRRKYE